MQRSFALLPALALLFAFAMPVNAAAPPGPFFQGFEKNTSGWFDSSNGWVGTITRVPSGYVDSGYADGIQSAAGHYHARVSGTTCDHTPATNCTSVYTLWGGSSA